MDILGPEAFCNEGFILISLDAISSYISSRYSLGRSLESLMPRFILIYSIFVIFFFTYMTERGKNLEETDSNNSVWLLAHSVNQTSFIEYRAFRGRNLTVWVNLINSKLNLMFTTSLQYQE